METLNSSSAVIMLKKCFQNKSVVAGAVILFVMILIAIFAPVIAPNDPYLTDGTMALKGPMEGYPFGTDELGRCVLSRMVYGARITIPYSLMSLAVAVVIGVPIGLISGFYKHLDNPLMRFMDILMAFPGMLLAIAIVATLGQGLGNVTIAVGLGSMPAYARADPRLGAVFKGNAIYRGIYFSWRIRSENPGETHSAQLHSDHRCLFYAGNGMDHHVYFHAEFFGHRCDTADSGMGRFDQRRQGLHQFLTPYFWLSGHLYFHYSDWIQPAG